VQTKANTCSSRERRRTGWGRQRADMARAYGSQHASTASTTPRAPHPTARGRTHRSSPRPLPERPSRGFSPPYPLLAGVGTAGAAGGALSAAADEVPSPMGHTAMSHRWSPLVLVTVRRSALTVRQDDTRSGWNSTAPACGKVQIQRGRTRDSRDHVRQRQDREAPKRSRGRVYIQSQTKQKAALL
jgi:hypothetical protein